MSEPSKTPRTDAERFDTTPESEDLAEIMDVVSYEFARTLEPELADALKDKERLDWLGARGGQWAKNLLVIPVPPPKEGEDTTPRDTTLREAIDAARTQTP